MDDTRNTLPRDASDAPREPVWAMPHSSACPARRRAPPRHARLAARCAGIAMWLFGACVHAADMQVSVAAGSGAVGDAVVSLHSSAAALRVKPAPAIIDQRDRQFVPLVTVVEVGSRIQFPNSDNIRHQVYSFSPAKTFQLPLYAGKPSDPVLFDRRGIVELGCNIHDWMLAYVVVEDTPYHGTTDRDGRVVIAGVPAGAYLLRVWHPDLGPGVAPYEENVVIGEGNATRSVKLNLVPRAPPAAPADDKLRQLQEKFKALQRGG